MQKRKYTYIDETFLGRLQRLHVIAKRLASSAPAGARRSRRLGDGLEFADHRDYSPGDDPRFIDWPYYARMEKLLLRLFHEHSEGELAILLDCSASMAPGGEMTKFNYARGLTAALAYVAMASLERVVLVPFGDHLVSSLRTGRNRGQIFGVLDFLEGLAPAGRTDLDACARRFARQSAGVGTVLVVSDLLDSAAVLGDGLARLAYPHKEVVVLHVCSPREAAPDLAGAMLLKAAEVPRQAALNITDELLESYRRGWKGFCQMCERACVSRGAVYVPAATDVPLDRLILLALRKAGVIGD